MNAVEPATGRYRFRDLGVVLLAAWAARTAFILLMPPAFSLDARHWYEVAEALEQGRNPYSVTHYLNWPPLWMQVTWAIAQLNTLTHLPFPRILQIVLILVESAAIVALFRLLRLLAPAADIRLALLAGISLNPIAILLICQHVNFDVIVALWIVLFVTSLVHFQRGGDVVDWLAACLFLGFAVLTKTVPIVLVPLLAHGARGLPAKARWLGAALVLGPVSLGMSVIYVLDPLGVTENVIAYRSFAGYFGISGLSDLLGIPEAGSWWAAVFPWALVACLLWIGRRLWQRANLSGGDLVVLAAMLLMIVPALGPGYGPNYIYWFLPLLVASAACETGAWRRLLVGFYAVAALTYLVEYGLFDTHGKFLVRLLPENPQVARWSQEWSSWQSQIVIRLPLFVGYLALLWGGASLLRRRLSARDVEAGASLSTLRADARWLTLGAKRPGILLLSAALAWALVYAVRPALRGGNGLAAQYYSNPTASGWPVHAVTDAVPSTAEMTRRWDGHAPDTFSVVWTGYLIVGRSDLYNFMTTSDDGSRLYIDGELVVDNGGMHSAATRTGQMQLARGPHRVRLEYNQAGGDFELAWLWGGEDVLYHPVPSWALSRRPVRYGTVVAARFVDVALLVLTGVIGLAGAWYVGTLLSATPAAERHGLPQQPGD